MPVQNRCSDKAENCGVGNTTRVPADLGPVTLIGTPESVRAQSSRLLDPPNRLVFAPGTTLRTRPMPHLPCPPGPGTDRQRDQERGRRPLPAVLEPATSDTIRTPSGFGFQRIRGHIGQAVVLDFTTLGLDSIRRVGPSRAGSFTDTWNRLSHGGNDLVTEINNFPNVLTKMDFCWNVSTLKVVRSDVWNTGSGVGPAENRMGGNRPHSDDDGSQRARRLGGDGGQH